MIWKILTIIIGSIIFSGFTLLEHDPYTIRPLLVLVLPISLVVELLISKGFKRLKLTNLVDSIYLGWSIIMFLLIIFYSTLTIELKIGFVILVLLDYSIRKFWKKDNPKNN